MTTTFNQLDKHKLIQAIQETVYDGVQICTITKYRLPRSNQQNKYLWAVVYSVIAGEIGEDVETVHQICGQKFLSERITISGDNSPETEETFVITKSTTKLNTVEFSAYTEAIRHWAWHELNISIPEPDSVNEKVMQEIRQKYNDGMWMKNFEEDGR